MIKLIASDLDGTLLKRDEAALSEETRVGISSALASGRELAVISGRDVLSLEKLFDFSNAKPYYIGCSGAVCVKDGKVLYSRPVPDTAVIKAQRYARDTGKKAVFCAADTVYVCGPDCFKKHIVSLYGEGAVTSVSVISDIKKPIYKISFYTLKGETGIDFSDFGVRLSYNKNGWTEYVNRFVNKGGALTALQSRLGVLRSNTASLGDSRDDCDMFEHSALSFAFGDEAEKGCPQSVRVSSFAEAYGMIIREK